MHEKSCQYLICLEFAHWQIKGPCAPQVPHICIHPITPRLLKSTLRMIFLVCSCVLHHCSLVPVVMFFNYWVIVHQTMVSGVLHCGEEENTFHCIANMQAWHCFALLRDATRQHKTIKTNAL